MMMITEDVVAWLFVSGLYLAYVMRFFVFIVDVNGIHQYPDAKKSHLNSIYY